jgi:hypothetical protein
MNMLEHIKAEGPAWYEVRRPMYATYMNTPLKKETKTDPLIDLVFVPEDEEKLKGVYRIVMKVRDLGNRPPNEPSEQFGSTGKFN